MYLLGLYFFKTILKNFLHGKVDEHVEGRERIVQLLGNVIVTISIVTWLHSEKFFYEPRSSPDSIRCLHGDKT